MASNDKGSSISFPEPSAEQRKVLDRIDQQRKRIHARSAAHRQVAALHEQQQSIDPDAPLSMRLLAFARMHPLAVAVAAAAAVVAGPSRLVRWAGIVVPLVSRLRR